LFYHFRAAIADIFVYHFRVVRLLIPEFYIFHFKFDHRFQPEKNMTASAADSPAAIMNGEGRGA
jgi:hypothetical protein